jgi:hypothetical protein
MANLNGNDIGTNYKGILSLDSTINTPLDATLRAVTDGEGNASPLQLSTDAVSFGGSNGLNWDNTNKRLGIGTSTPFSLLTVSGQSSFYSVQSAGAGSDFFYSDINPNLTAGANNQVVSLLRLRDRGNNNTGGFTGTQRLSLLMENAGGGSFPFQLFSETGQLKIGFSTITAPTAQLTIRGTGTTSATTSLLVQNSAGTETFKVQDDGSVSLGGLTMKNTEILGNPYFSGTAYGPNFLIQNSGAAQFGVSGAATASAILEASSTTRGFLPPRMTTTQKNAIATPAAGLVVYDTDLNKLCVYTTAWET